jgi:hypothetical protein
VLRPRHELPDLRALDGQLAPCRKCGAPLAIASRGQARCVYCLEAQPLPGDVAAPLAVAESLAAQLDEAKRRLGSASKGRKATWVILAVNLPGVLLAGSAIAWSAATQQSAVGALMFAYIGLGGMAPVVAIPILWWRVQKKARLAELARLPLAVPHVAPSGLSSSCPSCGAPHAAGFGRLTTTCTHCRVESLLPFPMVSAQLARQHQTVVHARLAAGAEGRAGMTAVKMWQEEVVPWILAFCILFGVGMVAFVIAAEMTT